MDLIDWMYSDIEEVPILTVCSWYLSCYTLVLEGDERFAPESTTHYEMW